MKFKRSNILANIRIANNAFMVSGNHYYISDIIAKIGEIYIAVKDIDIEVGDKMMIDNIITKYCGKPRNDLHFRLSCDSRGYDLSNGKYLYECVLEISSWFVR